MDLKKIWNNLLDSDLFYYNQEGMLLEKYENLLELFVKQLLSSLANSISIVRLSVVFEKPTVVSSKVRYFEFLFFTTAKKYHFLQTTRSH